MTDSAINTSDSFKTPRTGLVTVFTGDGKGKTTAAIGTAVRAVGYGLSVYIVFFLKGRMFSQGEVRALSHLPGVTTESYGTTEWVIKGRTSNDANKQAAKALAAASKAVSSGNFDLVIMDEINGALDFGLIPLNEVVKLISSRPASVDLILTGRHANNKIVEMADIVTEMVNVKHAYDRGVAAREGIDY